MSGVLASAGVKTETVFGTAVVVDRFFEFNSESMKLDVARIESAGLRASGRVQRADRFVVNRKGATGDITIEVTSKNFGWWLAHMFGSSATAGPTDSAYTHTGTVGALNGKFFTLQIGKPLAANSSNTVQAFTYKGCKLTGWELSCSVDGLLMFKGTITAQDESTGIALATPSYPTGADLLSFVGGAVTVGGSAWDVVSAASVTCNNNLKADRYFMRSSSLMKEPAESAFREFTVSLTGEFDALTTVYNQYASATPTGAVAAIVLTWAGPSVIGAGATYPSLVVTVPAARADGETPTVDGPDLLDMNPTFKAMAPTNGASPITAVFTTADSTA